MRSTTLAAVVLAAAWAALAVRSEQPAFKPDAGLKAAPVPVPFAKEDKPKDETGPATSYAVSSYPNVGTFYLEGKTGTCHYTWPVINGDQVTYLMYKADLKFIGSDKSGHYWHYQFPLAGGLNWYFPKRTDTPWLPTVWYKIEAPETKPVPYGTPIKFPTMIEVKK
jgi:hypothetical protein